MKNNTFSIKSYDFATFSDDIKSSDCLQHSFDCLDKTDKKIIQLERNFAEKNNFDIHPIIKDKRGIEEQEVLARGEMIKNEVEMEMDKIREEAFEKGYEEGKQRGRMDVYEQTKTEAREKLDILRDMINDILETKIKLIKKEKNQVYNLICTMVKWVILRELKEDGDYIKRLLDSLSQEIEEGTDILVRVDQESFRKMPEFVDYVKDKLKNFDNVKVEMGHDLKGVGIEIHSESEILSGTLEEQMKSLDKILGSYSMDRGDSDEIN